MSAEKAQKSMSAAKEPKKKSTTERRRSSAAEVVKTKRRPSDGGGKGSFGMGRRKSGEMSKESKMKQKKADETALRKNKVTYYVYL